DEHRRHIGEIAAMTLKTLKRRHLAVGAVLIGALAGAAPAFAEDAQPAQPPAQDAAPAQPPAPGPSAADTMGMDLFSKNTFTAMLDVRLAVANGATSFVNGVFGKARFQGNAGGGYSTTVAPVEADLVWMPRFSSSLSANISAAWQKDHTDSLDLMEAFVNYLPTSSGPVRFSARAGFMWPEISLEHATGGAWSVVNTITPSAINSWVGEEVKVIGGEATVRASLGEHDFGLTGGIFGGNDTSGTLVSYRGRDR